MKDRFILYFGLMFLAVFKIAMCFGLIIFLILFAPIFMFVDNKSFHWCMDELYKILHLK
jgi:hypothetical protein